MRNFRLAVLAGVALTLPSNDAQADGMHCANRLVSTGDSLYQVRSVCGQPDDAQRRVELRTVQRRVRGSCGGERRCERTEEYSVEVTVDEWTYDFGTRKFIRYLTFVDGRLAEVTTGSYGSDPEG